MAVSIEVIRANINRMPPEKKAELEALMLEQYDKTLEVVLKEAIDKVLVEE